MRGASDEISSRRRDEHEIGGLPKLYMGNLLDVIPDTRADRLARQCRPRGSADEFEGSCSGNDSDVVTGFSETAKNFDGLVGGNTACYTQDDAGQVCPGRAGSQLRSSTASEVSSPASISRRAIDRGFS